MNATLTNVSFYCTTSKRSFLTTVYDHSVWLIAMHCFYHRGQRSSMSSTNNPEVPLPAASAILYKLGASSGETFWRKWKNRVYKHSTGVYRHPRGEMCLPAPWAGPPGIFGEKYLLAMDKYIMVTSARPHCVQVKHPMRDWNWFLVAMHNQVYWIISYPLENVFW